MANKATSAPAATQAAGPQEPKAPGLFEIGELRKKHKVGRAVFAGVCSAQGWKPGRAVTEEEFLAKLPEIAANAETDACTPENPRETKAADFEKILKACYYDTDIDF